TDGKVGFKVGRWIAPTVTLSGSDFLDLEVTEGQWGADAPTEVSVKFVEPDNAWRESPSGTWVEDAGVNVVKDEPELYLVSNHNQASRLAKRIAKARRPQYHLSGTIGLMGYELIGQRFFTLTHTGMGIAQYFEVGTLVRASSGLFELTAISVEPEDFDFDASTEEPDRPEFEAIDSAFASEHLTGFTATAGDGGSIVTEWGVQEDYLWQQVRWKAVAATQWQSQTITDGATELIITGLLDGTTYQVQGRNAYAGLLSNPSDWTPEPAAEVVTVGSSTAPASLAAFSVTEAAGDVTIDFTTANDPNHYATRIYRNTVSDFGTAMLIATDYIGPNQSSTYEDAGLAAGTYYFWAVPVNASGVAGPASGPETETIV
ncbi:hypothetical protein SSE37_03450, partial [Sagittula stellata E-37]